MSDKSPIQDELEVIKCVCRDLWPIINGNKNQIENLKTNHQGTYVLGWKNDPISPSPPNIIVVGMVAGFLSTLGIPI